MPLKEDADAGDALPEIFVSFAPDDNAPAQPGSAGWVDQFARVLQQGASRYAGRNVVVSCDAKRGDLDPANGAYRRALVNAQLFIPILSPAYSRSDWCKMEFELFVKSARARGGVVTADRRSRILPVTTTPVPREQLPGEMQQLLGYDFFDGMSGLRLDWDDAHARAALLKKAMDLARDAVMTLLLPADKTPKTEAAFGLPADAPPPVAQAAAGQASARRELFICYAREDQGFALSLARDLGGRGIDVFIDQLSIPASADWDRTIDLALERCSMLTVVLSSHSVDSHQVRSEWLVAVDARKPVLPILREPCTIPRQLRLYQHLDMTAGKLDEDEVLSRLVDAVNSL